MDKNLVPEDGIKIPLFGMEIDPKSRREFYVAVAVIAAIVLVIPLLVGNYLMKVLYGLYMFIGLGLAWNYLSGYTGYVSFGPHMFIGLGAYALVGFTKHLGMNWPVALLGVTAVSLVLAAFIGVITMRISGIYFAIATLLLAEGLRQLAFWEESLTGFFNGSKGINGPFLGIDPSYYLFALMMIVSLVVTFETARTRFGLRMIALREDEEVLGTLGLNSLRYKIIPFAVHGVLTGLLGAVYAMSLGFVFPNTVFNIDLTITLVLVGVLGGMGTVWGAVLGAIVLIPLREALWNSLANLFIIGYGIALMLLMIYMPEGIINRLKEMDLLPESRGL